MIKVFLSHQSADSHACGIIAQRLKIYHDIDCYLDVIDPYMNRKGEDLAAHIQSEMSKCTQLLAVVSDATKASQWVPWEIGVATEKNYPLATYLAGTVTAPEFLRKWPYLRNSDDLDNYARASKAAERSYVQKRDYYTEATAKSRSTSDFFTTLRASLGQ